MYQSYSKFYEELQKAIRKRYDEGNPKEIKNDLKLLSEKFQIDFSEADSVRKSIENNFMNEWVSERTQLSNAGVEKITPEFAKIGGELNADIYRAVDRGLRNNLSMAEISALLKRTANFGGYRARTAARTAKMGKIRIEYLENHLKAGCREFEYAGPTGASSSADKPRKFCQEHLGKIYTVEQLLKLDNGQGLPVIIYMGGYNCRHKLKAIYR